MKTPLKSNYLAHKRRNLLFWSLGFLSFLWIIIRSGTNPKRLTYPCQQAAYPLASAWTIAVFGLLVGVSFLNPKAFKYILISLTTLSIGLFAYSKIPVTNQKQIDALPVWSAGENTVSNVFVYDAVPSSIGSLSAGDASVDNSYLSDPGIDSLLKIMQIQGNYFHKTTEHANGIVGANDVVIIKCNFQWRNRMGTNTDRIKGVIWELLNHPDGFSGEILVCDNGQSQIWGVTNPGYLGGFTDRSNNSDDPEQSIVDVVNTFKAKGYPVDFYEWDNLNTVTVKEYSDGDMNDGYVYNSTDHTSYPKFLTPKGNYISLQNGLWSTSAAVYDPDKLTIINMPVLKAHGMVGATIGLKNYIGCMNVTKSEEWYGADNDAFHSNYCFNEYALVARELDICWPRLTIIDATWVAPQNNYNYNQNSVHTKVIVASTDPVAASWYAAKYILQPVAQNPLRVDPDNPNAAYGKVLNNWYNFLAEQTERQITKDSKEISVYGKELLGNSTVQVNNDTSFQETLFYPNPNSGVITIESEKKVLMRIIDPGGNTLVARQIPGTTYKFEHKLKPGLYIIQFSRDGNICQSKKLIVK